MTATFQFVWDIPEGPISLADEKRQDLLIRNHFFLSFHIEK